MNFTRTTYSKYKAQKTTIDGITFDSKKESKRYLELKLLEKANKITDLKLQVPFVIIPKSKYGRDIKYICDFQYYENSELVVEDCKGYKTDVYKLKRRLMQEINNITIKEI